MVTDKQECSYCMSWNKKGLDFSSFWVQLSPHHFVLWGFYTKEHFLERIKADLKRGRPDQFL